MISTSSPRRAGHHEGHKALARLAQLAGDGVEGSRVFEIDAQALARVGRRLVEIGDRERAQLQFVVDPSRRDRDSRTTCPLRAAGARPPALRRTSSLRTCRWDRKARESRRAGRCGRGVPVSDQGAREHGAEAGTAAVFQQRRISHGAQPLQRGAVTVQRMAGKIKSDGAEFLAQPLMRQPIVDRREAQLFGRRRRRRTGSTGPLSRSRALRPRIVQDASEDFHQLAAVRAERCRRRRRAPDFRRRAC